MFVYDYHSKKKKTIIIKVQFLITNKSNITLLINLMII